jgi:hypothetical protein
MKKKIVILFMMSVLCLTACGSSSSSETVEQESTVNSENVDSSADVNGQVAVKTETASEITSAEEESDDIVKESSMTCEIYDIEAAQDLEYLAKVTVNGKDAEGNDYVVDEGQGGNVLNVCAKNAKDDTETILFNVYFMANMDKSLVDLTEYEMTEYDAFTFYSKYDTEKDEYSGWFVIDNDLNVSIGVSDDGVKIENLEEFESAVDDVLNVLSIEIVEE